MEETVKLVWSESLDAMDWEELSNLYKVAPLGNKNENCPPMR